MNTVVMINCENQPETVFLEAYGKVEGSAEYQTFGEYKGQWMVSVSKTYDVDTDSDCQFIGYFSNKQQALMELELAYSRSIQDGYWLDNGTWQSQVERDSENQKAYQRMAG